jgi:serine/threonine-protein kinase RsbW
MKLLHSLTLHSTYEEVEKVEGMLNDLQKKLHFGDDFFARLMLAVSEAATNAILHGNKLEASKKVSLEAFQSEENRLIFEVKDEGNGFDPQTLPDPLDDNNLLKTSGRGVFLMKEYANEVQYAENGTKLILRFNLPAK